MRRMNVIGIALATLALFSGVSCAQTGDSRRPLVLEQSGRWAGYGVSYGPFREGQRPGGPAPTVEQLREDLHILAEHFDLIRIYGSGSESENVLRIIREDGLSLRVMVGAWLGHDTATESMLAGAEGPAEGETEWLVDYETRLANRSQVADAIRLANDYPEIVWALNIGNETQVSWSGHKVSPERLIEHLRWARMSTDAPVTTADDYNFWNKPESVAVSAECDLIALHAYGMWNKQLLEDAVSWGAEQMHQIQELHGPGIPIVITEAGWATSKIDTGWQGELIVGEPGVGPQTEFTKAFLGWAAENGVVHFLFEAFDEPWKGGDVPAEVEKNWGLWYESREPKPAAEWLMIHGPRAAARSGG
ncbi:MAG: exo-beta-1,3-glucanase (GH17 family) [Phycisphaerales bacterium]|jgi:exo-beta-1,3-glucanase (GH17 family)